MLNSIIESSLRRPLWVVVVVVLAAVLGGVAYRGLRVDVLPDLALPVFTLNAENPQMTPEEMEALVTQPMESQLTGLPEATVVRSVTRQGVTSVTVQFAPDTDYWRDQQFVAAQLSTIFPLLPPGTSAPVLTSVTTRLAQVYEFTLEGKDLRALRSLAEWQIRTRLMEVPGVTMVTAMGGYVRQYNVTVDPAKLRTYGLSLHDVETALEEGNANPSGGFLRRGPIEYTVRGIGRFHSLDDIAATVISEVHGTPVTIRNVADVTDGHMIRRGIARRNGRQCVTVTVTKQFGANTIKVVDGVRRALRELQSGFPRGVTVHPFYDQTTLVHQAIRDVTRAVFIGAALVIAVVLLLLGNLRCSLVVATSLPVSVLITGVLLRWFGIGLNTMTLGGIAVAVVIMVDASIIMTENIFHRLHEQRHQPRHEVVLHAAWEMGRPITFATLIIIAVFSPLFFLGGLEGLMFGPLARTVCLAMAVSLVVALTFVVVMSRYFVRATDATDEVGLIRALKRAYIPALEYALRHSGRTRLVTLAITLVAFALTPLLGKEFMPKLDEGALMITTLMSADTGLAESDRMGGVFDRILLSNPWVEQIVRRTGHTEAPVGEAEPVSNSETLVSLKPDHPPTQVITGELRARIQNVRGISAVFTQPLANQIEEGLAGTPASLSVKLFGPDLGVLGRYGEEIRKALSTIPGVVDLSMDQPAGVPQLQIVIDRDEAARFGVRVADVASVIDDGIGGRVVTRLLRNMRSHGVFVRLRRNAIDNPEKIGSLLVNTSDGDSVPLREIAHISFANGPAIIRREAMSRRIAVDCNVSGHALGRVAAEAQRRLQPLMRRLPKDYYFVFGGDYANALRAARSLRLAVLIALCIVFLLLFAALDSVAHALIILSTLPDAFVGGIAALLLAHGTFNVSSAVGFIALFGVAVQNGLVLVTQTNRLRAEGLKTTEAVRQASISRVRPKLMTAFCAIFGLLPMVLLPGAGSAIEGPLAIVMIGGLVTSTLFTLLVLPTMYVMVERWQTSRNLREKIMATD